MAALVPWKMRALARMGTSATTAAAARPHCHHHVHCHRQHFFHCHHHHHQNSYKKRVYRQYPGLPYERQSLIEKAHLWQPKSGSNGQHSNSVNLVLTQTITEGKTNNHSCHSCVGSGVRGWRSESFTRFFSSSWLALPPVVMCKVRWLSFRRVFWRKWSTLIKQMGLIEGGK